jgi:glycosyltransferase involved in cell wall biosynthesis
MGKATATEMGNLNFTRPTRSDNLLSLQKWEAEKPPARMRIGFLWHCVYPWDVRLEKIMKAMTEQGHSACLVCRGRQGLPKRERIGDLDIHRVLIDSTALGWSNKLAGFPLFFSPVWIHQTLKRMREAKINLLIVRDLPLALMAGWIGKALKVPVVLDMAENYPAALIAYQNRFYKPFLINNGWLPRQYEQAALKMLDHVLVVAEEQKQRLQDLGVDSRKITVVGNTPERSFYGPAACSEHGGRSGNAVNLLYVGFLDTHRGIDLVIRAMPRLVAEFPNLRLTMVGDGKAKRKAVELADSLGLSHVIDLPGWVDFRDVPEYIRRSTVCLIPHLRCEHTETTLPNKLFDYMAFSKPVVSADCAPLQRIIDESGCGLTFKSGDAVDFQRVVRKLLSEADLAKIGRNGRKAIERKYNWEVDRQALLATIRELGSSREYARSGKR